MDAARFLKQLKEANWFPRLQATENLQELAELLPALLSAQDFEALKELETQLKEAKQLSPGPLMAMALELGKQENGKALRLRKVVLESFQKALKSKSMATEEVEKLLMACKEDKELVMALRDQCCHRRRLESLPRPSAGCRELMNSRKMSGFKELIASFDRASVAISPENHVIRCPKTAISDRLGRVSSIFHAL